MTLDDLVGYKLTCKMSEDLKKEPDYNDKEFFVVVSKDSKSGYKAVVSGENIDGETFEDVWDATIVGNNILFDTWRIKSKEKI